MSCEGNAQPTGFGSQLVGRLGGIPTRSTATLLTKVLENGPSLHPEGNVRAGRAVLWSRLEATLNTLDPPWRGELNELLRAVRVSTALSAPGFVAAILRKTRNTTPA